MSTIVISFVFFLLIFVFIGILSIIKNSHTNADYLLAGQNVKPWLVSLSAVATSNSGYMFAGMIGYTYQFGLSSIWLMVGWIFGDFLASLFIHKRLRITSEKEGVLSFAGVLSQWGGVDYKKLRFVCGVITIIFLGAYAAAQLNASSKALHVLFNWDYSVGAIIGAILVVIYCYAGGIRASIWTDAAQSFVMIFAMFLLLVISIYEIGDVFSFFKKLNQVSPTYMSFFSANLPFGVFFGPLLFVVSWMFAGFGVIGQPHIMVRFMAMDNPKDLQRVRIYYYSWYIAFSILTIGTGLAARLLLPEFDILDVELALPKLAVKMLPDLLIGLIMAGLFAATMSTADSQILSCSAAITRDFAFGKKVSYVVTKLATVFVALIALLIALYGSKSVFTLVVMSWSFLACSFAPLLTIYALGGRISEKTAIVTVFTGIIFVFFWRQFGLHAYFNEVGPGILVAFVPYLLRRVYLAFLKKTELP